MFIELSFLLVVLLVIHSILLTVVTTMHMAVRYYFLVQLAHTALKILIDELNLAQEMQISRDVLK